MRKYEPLSEGNVKGNQCCWKWGRKQLQGELLHQVPPAKVAVDVCFHILYTLILPFVSTCQGLGNTN